MSRAVVLLVLLALSIGVNIGLWTRQSRSPAGPPPPGGPLRDHLLVMRDELGLDEAQVQELRSVHDRLAPELRRRERELAEARRRFREDVLAQGDRDLVQERMHEFRAVQSTLDSLVAEILLAEARVLTPEQRRRWAEREPPPPPPGRPPPGPPPHR